MKNLLLIISLIIITSCTRSIKNSEHNEQELEINLSLINETNVNNKNDINFTSGYINDNNLRIRSNPNTNSEILGQLNIGDFVKVIDKTEYKDKVINTENYWYRIITNENITGWIFGEYLELIPDEIPLEFKNYNSSDWNRYYGNLSPIEKINVGDLQSCSWSGDFINLYFSKEGNYLLTAWRFTSCEYGRYKLQDNTVYFFPPLEVYRFSKEFKIDKLLYSHELHFEGAPVLKIHDETVIFSPHFSENPKTGETVRMYQHYCEKINEKGKLNKNGFLYAFPDKSSKNLFDNYYGYKAREVTADKLAKTSVGNIVWYYTRFDFTTGDPIDGGGPFYQGWLPEDYFE
jgi:hypothetical protein